MSTEVLLVEDDPNYRRSIKLLFRDKPYRFIEAGSPAEGIAQLASHPQIQVILLDLQYESGSSGMDVLEHIKERATQYRVIVLTGRDDLLAAEQAGDYAVFNYLPKAKTFPRQAIRFSVDQAFKDLERVELQRKSQFVLDVQNRINDNEPPEKTLAFICQAVLSTVGAYTCHVRVYDFNRGDYHLKGFAGPDDTLRKVFDRPKEKGEFFSGRVVESGKSEFFEDLQSLDEFRRFAAMALQGREPLSGEDQYWRTVSSAYIVPIKTRLFGDTVDAVLNVSSQAPRFFSQEKRELVDEFVMQAALTVAKDWLKLGKIKIHRDYKQIGEMLGEISDELNGDNALTNIYNIVTERISKLVHPEVISIFRLNEWTSRLETVAELGGMKSHDGSVESYGPGQKHTGSVFQDETTINEIVSEGINDNPPGYLSHIPSGPLRHYLGVPIRVGGKVQGVLRAMNKKSRYYSEVRPLLLDRGFSIDCRYIVEIAATILGVAIRHAELLGESKRRVELVQMLGAVSRLISGTHTVDELLSLTTQKMADVMQAHIAMLFLVEGGERVVLRRACGMDLIEASYGMGEGVTGWVAQSQEPVLIQTATRRDGKYDAEIGNYLPEQDGRPGVVESVMAVPIIRKGTTLGVMKVVNRREGDPNYNGDDLELFSTFAEYVAVAIENANLFELASEEIVIHKRNSALSTLVSAVAHEIRNTSGLIPANVAGLRAQLGSVNELAERRLALIERVAGQATDFANELAGFSAARRGEKQLLDINEVIRGAITELQELPKYKNTDQVHLSLQLSETPLLCELFENPFVQIVRNIVINGFQALEDTKDGVIAVSSSGQGDFSIPMAVVRFEDNGPGIPVDYKAKIFEPDFTTKPNGNGIGLWLARTQLEQVGGTIALEEKEGEGARFVVSIPLVAQQRGEQSDGATLTSPAR
jgi:signal transduction histidine kinase/CheY-like chemotaxis protein